MRLGWLVLKNLRMFYPQATVILTAQRAPCALQNSPAETRRLRLAIAAEGLMKLMLFRHGTVTATRRQAGTAGLNRREGIRNDSA